MIGKLPGIMLLVAATGCSPSSSQQSALARAESIDRSALIVADQSISINAPPAVVWKVLSQIDKWPTWQPSIKETRINGPVAAGQTFEWSNNGTKINSIIEVAKVPSTIVWTGNAMGLKAVHVWQLVAKPDGRTVVRTAESMRGFPSSLFYSSTDLREANANWLKALKTRAERELRNDSR